MASAVAPVFIETSPVEPGLPITGNSEQSYCESSPIRERPIGPYEIGSGSTSNERTDTTCVKLPARPFMATTSEQAATAARGSLSTQRKSAVSGDGDGGGGDGGDGDDDGGDEKEAAARSKIIAMLPEIILDAGAITTKNGLSESLARKSLVSCTTWFTDFLASNEIRSFSKYLNDFQSKVSAVLATADWREPSACEHLAQRMGSVAHKLEGAAGLVCASRAKSMSKRLKDVSKAFAQQKVRRKFEHLSRITM
eukprot:3634573-Pleurochrysis_carterae.AAC.2